MRTTGVYSALLKLFPTRHQQRFGSDMAADYLDGLSEARRAGQSSLLFFYLREFADLPGCILREHWLAIASPEGSLGRQPAVQAAGPALASGGHMPAPSWGQAFLAGLPHLLLALLMGLPPLLAGLGMLENTGSQAAFILLAATGGLSIPAFLIALRRKKSFPAWAASWLLAACIAVVAAARGASNLAGLEFNPSAGTQDLLFMAFPLALAYLIYRAARRDRTSGLLAALPFSILIWSPFLEQTPNWEEPELLVGSAWLAAWFLAGLAASAVLRMGWKPASLWLAIGTSAAAGLYHSYIGIYHGGMLPFSEPGPSPRAALAAFLPVMVTAGWVLVGPQLAAGIRQLGLKCGPGGRAAYRTSLLGILLMVVSFLINFNRTWQSVWGVPGRAALTGTLAGAGLLAYAAGLAWLLVKSVNRGILPATSIVLLQFLAPLGAPGTLLLPYGFGGLNMAPEAAQPWILAGEILLLGMGISLALTSMGRNSRPV